MNIENVDLTVDQKLALIQSENQRLRNEIAALTTILRDKAIEIFTPMRTDNLDHLHAPEDPF